MNESRAGTPGPRNVPDGGREASQRQVRVRLQMVRTGVTTFATLGGIACYVLLLEFRLVTQPVAFVIGLVFALLVRVAAGSLARDWMRAQLSRREGDGGSTSGTDATRRS